MRILCIDIGGTSIKFDVYDENGESYNSYSELLTRVDYDNKTNCILEQIITIIKNISTKFLDTIYGVAISSAGVIDPENGNVAYAGYTIPNYIGVNIKNEVENYFNIPCWVLNDVNSAALGEHWMSSLNVNHPTIYLTIGTGIGGAIIVNNEIINGYSGTAGEVGYIPLENKTWQELASTKALCKYFKQEENIPDYITINGEDVFEAYDNKISSALVSVDKFIYYLCKGALPLIYLLNPHYIVFGGGIFARDEILIDKIKNQLSELIEDAIFLPENVFAAKNGNEANRLGALKYFLQKKISNYIN